MSAMFTSIPIPLHSSDIHINFSNNQSIDIGHGPYVVEHFGWELNALARLLHYPAPGKNKTTNFV